MRRSSIVVCAAAAMLGASAQAQTKVAVAPAGVQEVPTTVAPLIDPTAPPLAAPSVLTAVEPLAPSAVVALAPGAAEGPTALIAPPAAARGESSPIAADARSEDPGVARDRARFDGAGPAEVPPDVVPEWPGATGDTVRIGGRVYVLGQRLGEKGTNAVYRVQGRPLAIKLIHPDLKDVDVWGGEKAALREIERTSISHAALRDSSADGLVLVKDLIEGQDMAEIEDKGPLTAAQKSSLLNLAVELVSRGRTADLNAGNLVWQKDARRWVLIDVGGYAPAKPWGPLGQILSESRRKLNGIDGAAFLRALRDRLGPDSPAWRGVESGAGYPYQKEILIQMRLTDKR